MNKGICLPRNHYEVVRNELWKDHMSWIDMGIIRTKAKVFRE